MDNLLQTYLHTYFTSASMVSWFAGAGKVFPNHVAGDGVTRTRVWVTDIINFRKQQQHI